MERAPIFGAPNGGRKSVWRNEGKGPLCPFSSCIVPVLANENMNNLKTYPQKERKETHTLPYINTSHLIIPLYSLRFLSA